MPQTTNVRPSPQPLTSYAARFAADYFTSQNLEFASNYQRYAPVALSEDDPIENNVTNTPIIDSFRSIANNATFPQMTNYTVMEVFNTWSKVENYVVANWNVGRGSRCEHSALDVFFMSLVVLKQGGAWDYNAKMFKMKDPTFERMIVKFLRVLEPILYEQFVTTKASEYTMHQIVTSGRAFAHYPCARYAADVTFQQANRLAGTMQETKPFFSNKHKLYGYNVEVSVLPNGYAIGCTNHHRGATADIEIFRSNAEFHLREMKKTTEQDKRITDHGPLPEKKADCWAILVDKGYQGLQEKFRAIHPTKSSGNASLPTETFIENRNISSDRIIVENFFGRLCSIWRVCADKYRWSEDLYDTIMRCCVALTNCHIETLALRAEDTNFFLQRLQRLRDISNETTRKRKLVQEKYRMKRRQRLSLGCTDESYPQF